MSDPLRDFPALAAEADAPPVIAPFDATRLEAHRLTPAEMIRVGLDLSLNNGPGPMQIGIGYIDGLVDLLLFLPLDELTALRAEFLPPPATEQETP